MGTWSHGVTAPPRGGVSIRMRGLVAIAVVLALGAGCARTADVAGGRPDTRLEVGEKVRFAPGDVKQGQRIRCRPKGWGPLTVRVPKPGITADLIGDGIGGAYRLSAYTHADGSVTAWCRRG
jgi:hypothetical protein